MGTEHITVLVCNRCGMRVEGSPPGWLHLTRPSVSYCPKCRNGDAPNGSQYDEDYFLRGKQTGKSLYEDYRWLPELTRPMVATGIGLRANATAMLVPSSIRVVCSAASVSGRNGS